MYLLLLLNEQNHKQCRNWAIIKLAWLHAISSRTCMLVTNTFVEGSWQNLDQINPVTLQCRARKSVSPGQVDFLSGQVTLKAYQMKNDPHSCECYLCNKYCISIRSLKKFRTLKGFEPMILQYWCDPSNQLSYEATDVRSWSIMCLYVPVKEIKCYKIMYMK